MLSLAGLALAAGQLLDPATITALGVSDDARAIPRLESTLEAGVVALGRFPAKLPPLDVADEITAALIALERLDPGASLVWARKLMSAGEAISFEAHRVAARAGDVDAIRAALEHYDANPEAWRRVLGDAAVVRRDVRLRDFIDFAALPDAPTPKLLRTTLRRRLGDEALGVVEIATRDRSRPLRARASADDAALAGLPAVRGRADDEDVGRVASTRARDPDALILMYRFHQRHPRRFLQYVESPVDPLRERAHFVMALSGDARRLPLLIGLASSGRGVSRDAALRGLAEVDLGSFDKRLHRLAGDPSRDVRFGVALALVPEGEGWAVRLAFATVDDDNMIERRSVRRALERLERSDAIALVEQLILDGPASPFAIELYLEWTEARSRGVPLELLWAQLESGVRADDALALLAAARLPHREARAAVRRYLER